jgi:hypothetical protein
MENLTTFKTGFYEAGLMRQVATNLFYGWGYNFYRLENQQRTTDLLIRGKISDLLSQAVASVTESTTAYRKNNIPPPSRANPYPPTDVLLLASALEDISKQIHALEGLIRSAPAPENDRMWQMHRGEAQTLQELLNIDAEIVGVATTLNNLVKNKSAEALMADKATISEGIAAIKTLFRRRQDYLQIRIG